MATQEAPHRFPAAKSEITQLIAYGMWAGALLLPAAWLLGYLRLPQQWNFSDLRYAILALHLGLFLLAVPVCLYLFPSKHQYIHWITYPFLDKRWIFALYWLAIGTFLFLPYLFRFVFQYLPAQAAPVPRKYKSRPKATQDAPPSGALPDPLPPAAPRSEPPAHSGRWRVRAIFVLAAAALSWYFAGPPWNLERHHRGIDSHEQVHLGPLQAIDKGYLPYIGPASTQYGPGSQLVTYSLMKRWNQFDIVGYRNAGAAIYWAATFVAFLVLFLSVPLWSAPLALLFAQTYSPLTLYHWGSDGALGGFHGWGNAMRYLGVLVVAAGLPVALRKPVAAFVLGIAWGAFSWMSQENLSSVLAAGTLFLALLWLSQTCPGRAILRTGAALVAGFAAAWIPVLAYYAYQGALSEFLRCYFLVPSAVVQGFSNSLWSSGTNDPQYRAFLFTPTLVVALGLCTIVRFDPFSLRSPLEPRQVRFLSFLCALAACYAASLFRSDSSHSINTMIALPAVLTIALSDLPRWTASRTTVRWAIRAAIVVAAIWLFPLRYHLAHPVEAIFKPPMRKFRPAPPAPAVAPDARVPFQRATLPLSDEPQAFDGAWPMREFLEELSGVREIIGNRPTYIEGYPRALQGLVYFLLDATPAPFLLDKMMMEINTPLREEAMAYYAEHVRETKCLISPNPNAPEVRLFRQAYPDARVFERKIGQRDYRVYVAP